jgi:hypothetical protein
MAEAEHDWELLFDPSVEEHIRVTVNRVFNDSGRQLNKDDLVTEAQIIIATKPVYREHHDSGLDSHFRQELRHDLMDATKTELRRKSKNLSYDHLIDRERLIEDAD